MNLYNIGTVQFLQSSHVIFSVVLLINVFYESDIPGVTLLTEIS